MGGGAEGGGGDVWQSQLNGRHKRRRERINGDGEEDADKLRGEAMQWRA